MNKMENTNEQTFMQMLHRAEIEMPKRSLKELMDEMKKMIEEDIVDIDIKPAN